MALAIQLQQNLSKNTVRIFVRGFLEKFLPRQSPTVRHFRREYQLMNWCFIYQPFRTSKCLPAVNLRTGFFRERVKPMSKKPHCPVSDDNLILGLCSSCYPTNTGLACIYTSLFLSNIKPGISNIFNSAVYCASVCFPLTLTI